MHKDLKMGLFLGIALTIGAVLYLAIHPSMGLNHLRIRSAATNGRLQKPEMPHANQPPTEATEPTEPMPSPENSGTFDWTMFEKEANRKTERFHILGKNETLSEVARQYYGSPGQWRKIYNANRAVIKDPDTLRPGTKLIIPD